MSNHLQGDGVEDLLPRGHRGTERVPRDTREIKLSVLLDGAFPRIKSVGTKAKQYKAIGRTFSRGLKGKNIEKRTNDYE